MLTQQFIFVTRIRFNCVLFNFSLLMSLFMSSKWNLTLKPWAYLEFMLMQKDYLFLQVIGMNDRVTFLIS